MKRKTEPASTRIKRLYILHEKYYIQTRSGAQKESITAGKMHRHGKYLLSHLKPENAAKIIS